MQILFDCGHTISFPLISTEIIIPSMAAVNAHFEEDTKKCIRFRNHILVHCHHYGICNRWQYFLWLRCALNQIQWTVGHQLSTIQNGVYSNPKFLEWFLGLQIGSYYGHWQHVTWLYFWLLSIIFIHTKLTISLSIKSDSFKHIRY